MAPFCYFILTQTLRSDTEISKMLEERGLIKVRREAVLLAEGINKVSSHEVHCLFSPSCVAEQ
jgi:hypothetical protein